MPSPVKIQAKVDRIEKHTDSVVSYVFTPLRKVPRFKPGQFLHLALDEYDPSSQWPESRVFSIASSPTRRNNIEITVSVKGKFTQRIYNEIKPDSTIWLKMPYGDFTFDTDLRKNMVLIAGGTGFTPFKSFLEYCIDKELHHSIQLYYGIREEKLFIFDDIINESMQKNPNFNFVNYNESSETISDPMNVRCGRLQMDTIAGEIDLHNSIVYLSGPFAMVDAFRQYLEQTGYEKKNIKIDNWE